jgi:hypothetical protein
MNFQITFDRPEYYEQIKQTLSEKDQDIVLNFKSTLHFKFLTKTSKKN